MLSFINNFPFDRRFGSKQNFMDRIFLDRHTKTHFFVVIAPYLIGGSKRPFLSKLSIFLNFFSAECPTHEDFKKYDLHGRGASKFLGVVEKREIPEKSTFRTFSRLILPGSFLETKTV